MDERAKIAILCRVSKDDGSQNTEVQEDRCLDMAKALGGNVVAKYIYNGSGGHVGTNDTFIQMLKDSDARKFKLLIVWSLDRFSREGISNTLGYIRRLKRNGVAIKSLQEPWLDTRDEGLADLLLAIFSWVGAQEHKRIVTRTQEKLNFYKKQIEENGFYTTKKGKKKFRLGRPKGKTDSKPRDKSGYYTRWSKQKGR